LKVKICGITNVHDAEYSIKKGAEFIGVILDYSVKRHGTEDLIKEIKNIKKTGVVGVYTSMPDANEINEDIIQLHFDHSPGDVKYIKNVLKKNVISVIDISKNDYLERIDEYKKAGSDYILLEDRSGIVNRMDDLRNIDLTGIGLAGKISPENVSNILSLNPEFIDLSSSLESEIGKKSEKRIDELFIKLGEKNALKQY
jgi:phosphoribosylanthranilate isomerase